VKPTSVRLPPQATGEPLLHEARAAWVETSVPTRELPLKKRHTFYSVGEILLDVTPPALFVSKAIHQRQSNLTGARLEVFGNGG